MTDLIDQGRNTAVVALIDNELDRLMSEGNRRAREHGSAVSRLWAMSADHLHGGKLLRPRLLVDVYDGLCADLRDDGRIPAVADRGEAVRLAAAVEVLHFAFLLHDDVLDNDFSRRGRENLIAALYRDGSGDQSPRRERGPLTTPVDVQQDGGRLHWARSAAVLVGDQMLSLAHQVFARTEVPRPERLALLDLLDDVVRDSAAGEFLDVSLSDGIVPPTEETIREMTRTKTATYTVELPLRAALVLTGAGAEAGEPLIRAGRHLGIAFQLQDDALSTFGRAPEHGKDPCSDLREGKQTAILAFARTTELWNDIAGALAQDDLTGASGRHVRALLIDCGAEAHVRMLIDRELGEARSLLSGTTGTRGASPRSAQVLHRLVEELTGRTR